MSIDKRTCYVLGCDGCQCAFENYDKGVCHFESEGEAWDVAKPKGWTTDGKIHHCESCSRHRALVDPNAKPEIVPVVVSPGQIPLGEQP